MRNLLNLRVRSSMSLNYSWMAPKEIFICYWGKDDHEVKFAHLFDRIDEQYSRRNCLLFVGIEERDDEDADALVLDVCNSELEVEVSLEDTEGSHRLGARIHQQGEWNDNAEASQRSQQTHRPIIVKFNSY